jgi:hypothetical protein
MAEAAILILHKVLLLLNRSTNFRKSKNASVILQVGHIPYNVLINSVIIHESPVHVNTGGNPKTCLNPNVTDWDDGPLRWRADRGLVGCYH